VRERLIRADEAGDADYAIIWLGQSAGLIDSVMPAANIVRSIVKDAEELLRTTLPSLVVR